MSTFSIKYSHRHGTRTALLAVALASCLLRSPAAPAQDSVPEINPAAKAVLQEARAALHARHSDEAEKLFKKAAKLAGDSCLPCFTGLAQAQMNLDRIKDALKSADKALALAQNDEDRADVHSLRGYILAESEGSEKELQVRIKQAEEAYRQAVRLNPEVADYHLNLGVVLMRESQDEEGKKEAGLYLQQDPHGRFAAYAQRLLANPRRARENYAPDISLPLLNGGVVELGDFAGKYVVLDFWATWCPPCRASVGELQELTQKYPREKLILISISADRDEEEWKNFIARKNMEWMHYRDANGMVLRAFRVHALPTYILIDPEGIIRQRIVGLNPQQSIIGRLKSALAALPIAGPPRKEDYSVQ